MNNVYFSPQHFGGFVFYMFFSGFFFGLVEWELWKLITFPVLSVISFLLAMNLYAKDNK